MPKLLLRHCSARARGDGRNIDNGMITMNYIKKNSAHGPNSPQCQPR